MKRHWLRTIGIFEIIGGAAGLVFAVWWLALLGVSGETALLALIMISIYVLSVVAGIGLLRGRPFGRTASIIVQAIQLFKLFSPPLTFMFSFGFDFFIYFISAAGRANLGFQLNVLSNSQLVIKAQDAPFGIGVSITAALFLAALSKAKGQAKGEEMFPPPPPPTGWA